MTQVIIGKIYTLDLPFVTVYTVLSEENQKTYTVCIQSGPCLMTRSAGYSQKKCLGIKIRQTDRIKKRYLLLNSSKLNRESLLRALFIFEVYTTVVAIILP